VCSNTTGNGLLLCVWFRIKSYTQNIYKFYQVLVKNLLAILLLSAVTRTVLFSALSLRF